MTDPIADMFTRIRNAAAIRKATVIVPHSKVKEAILRTLKAEGYIEAYRIVEKTPQNDIEITLKYLGQTSGITELKRVSKPGRRVYIKRTDIGAPLSGFGITIITTNQGIMTNKEAKKRQLGGEIICQVW